MNPLTIMLIGLVISIVLFAIFWIVQYVIDDSGIVDVGWGASVAIVGVFFCWMANGNPSRRWLGAVLICVWAARLSVFLFLRWRSHEEDARYAALKEKWGDQAQIRMFRFYQMQGLGCYLFALPLLVASLHEGPIGWTDWLGVVIWMVAIVGEAVSDHQLASFRRQPENKGEVCQSGLWKYSRHPNYFFEWLHWCAYVMLAITAPLGWLTILAPVAMWFFLNRVTGIPLNEIQAIKSRGDKYRHYQQTTSAFFPWFPQEVAEEIDTPTDLSKKRSSRKNSISIDLAERGLVPDRVVRAGIRRLLKKRLAKIDLGDETANEKQFNDLVAEFSQGPIALMPEKANEQHYEVPAELFKLTLGPRRKYSSCFFADGVTNLAEAEEEALRQTCERAGIADGMRVLELGCGWGSLSLWMAEQFPNAELTVVSNSNSQREFIESKSRELGIDRNLNVVTCDINDLALDSQFDRVVSVEMFEHVRNHQLLMNRISKWLKPDGKLFVHIFCHRKFTYRFQDEQKDDWMSRYFFSGGIMPGDDLLPSYQDDLSLEKKWCWNGRHYQATSEAWLANMDRNKSQIMPVLEGTYGKQESVRWFNRWRLFYLACSELFGFSSGNEWWVSHYLFSNKGK